MEKSPNTTDKNFKLTLDDIVNLVKTLIEPVNFF